MFQEILLILYYDVWILKFEANFKTRSLYQGKESIVYCIRGRYDVNLGENWKFLCFVKYLDAEVLWIMSLLLRLHERTIMRTFSIFPYEMKVHSILYNLKITRKCCLLTWIHSLDTGPEQAPQKIIPPPCIWPSL